ncbi:MAG: hypothetical protein EXS58_01410 [Candidatus Latescibacteria bacterium]|nr:hypothetical protein [Candidatus Latescibacterota bacterium]
MIHLQFARFLIPLALTLIAQGFSSQFLTGGMARLPQATQVLAAYGVAWGLADFLASPLSQINQLSLVLAANHPARRQIQRFALLGGLCLALVLASLAFTPLGDWVIYQGHGLDAEVGQSVRWALFWLVPIPLCEGINRSLAGLLMRARRTEVISYATLGSIGASIAAVFALLPTDLVREEPMSLPLLVAYTGIAVYMGVLFWGYRRWVAPGLAPEGEAPALDYLFRFFWPLALVMAIQGLSRPLINFFVARGPEGQESLAVLAVVYSLAHLPYGWVNEVRSLAPAFQGEPGSLYHIRRFAAGCGLLSFSIMALAFWSPLRGFILGHMLGLDPVLAGHCQWPLFLFSFFPLAVALRAYFHGVALIEHRTRALAPSAPARIGIIWVMMMVLPQSVPGATRGIGALLSGFVLEAAVVWWGVRGGAYLAKWRKST